MPRDHLTLSHELRSGTRGYSGEVGTQPHRIQEEEIQHMNYLVVEIC